MQRYFALALIFLWAVPAPTYGQTQSAPAAPPVELLISGSRLIRYGQDMAITIAAVNRSAAPVAISKRQNGTIYSTFSWKMLDPDGKEPPPRVENRDTRGVCPLSSPLDDKDLVILQPGEKYLLTRDGDPSLQYSFPRKGVYRLTVHYSFDARFVRDLPGVSANSAEVLRQTPAMELASKELKITLY